MAEVVTDWTTRGCHRRLCVLNFRSFGGMCETASCPVTVAEYMHVHQHAKLVNNSSMAHTESQWLEFKD